ncbi:MAG: hypothetical protein EAZ13_07320 [Sphingobacteriia bacterium]|nr:MAG: hypothetical protein EAZ13_07320 [Sphingobacteriia bacterium]
MINQIQFNPMVTLSKKIGYNQIHLTCSLIFILIIFIGCKQNQSNTSLFTALNHATTGLHFRNQLTPTASLNPFTYMYYYNGGGIGSGDFNNDGYTDLFFTANQGRNILYLNKHELLFEDISDKAMIPQDTEAWNTGVSVVDINQDGLLDIYICKVDHFNLKKTPNQLLICKGIDKYGIPYYTDEAEKYGLNFSGYSTQAVFFDYDGDDDLDMFLLNHSINHDGNYAARAQFNNQYDSVAGDRLYQNNTSKKEDGNSTIYFIDKTKEAKIIGSKISYGLGVAVADIDLDGWPDIYVGNDFHENDYLYINQKNGTFKELSNQQLMHTSQFTMGVDIADVNSDAYPDIISMDMLPYESVMLRRSLSEDDYTIFQQKISLGYAHQYARNNLQFNRGDGKFSEIGQYAGMHATDWSWAPLWMDFDNDGKKDLFISNGIPKRFTDIDYVNFVAGDDMQKKLQNNTIQDKDFALLNKFPEIKIPNQFFLNGGNFKFKNISDNILKNPPSFSNGAAYADFDNDGDLDIVVNNINDEVLLYANNIQLLNTPKKKYTTVDFEGYPQNKQAIGAKVLLFEGDRITTYENQFVHGFQSSMSGPIHIGLQNIKPDSILLIWPNNRYEKIDLKPNQLNILKFKKGLPLFNYATFIQRKNSPHSIEFVDISKSTGLFFKHNENNFNEFDRESLIPKMLSAEGPAIAVADINHDGLEDVFIGASKTFHNAVFIQNKSGKFVQMAQPDLLVDSIWENVDATWVDINQDTHPDLVIASGGNEYYGTDQHLNPLLYLNDGKGKLTKKSDAFDQLFVTQSKVVASDFNGDGAIDLFLAGRAIPWQYGITPRSYLLQNDGTGKFKDVTAAYSKALIKPGMVSSAQWVDLTGDKQDDLLLSYEWGGIDLFVKKDKEFIKKVITDRNGWWQFVLPVDIDGDGDLDMIAGNAGLNIRLKASLEKPVKLYLYDFDANGSLEQLLTYYLGNIEMPFASKNQLEKKLPYLKQKYLYAADFANADLAALMGAQKLKAATLLKADCFDNALLLNEGNLNFTIVKLPFEAQLSMLKTAAILPISTSKHPAILLMGNSYHNNIEIGRQDADFGTIIAYQGKEHFSTFSMKIISINGQVNHIKPVKIGKQQAYIIGRNNDSLKVITTKKQINR